MSDAILLPKEENILTCPISQPILVTALLPQILPQQDVTNEHSYHTHRTERWDQYLQQKWQRVEQELGSVGMYPHQWCHTPHELPEDLSGLLLLHQHLQQQDSAKFCGQCVSTLLK